MTEWSNFEIRNTNKIEIKLKRNGLIAKETMLDYVLHSTYHKGSSVSMTVFALAAMAQNASPCLKRSWKQSSEKLKFWRENLKPCDDFDQGLVVSNSWEDFHFRNLEVTSHVKISDLHDCSCQLLHAHIVSRKACNED